MSIYIDETAHVSDKAKIGDGTKIWINVQVREEAEIGTNCIISKEFADRDEALLWVMKNQLGRRNLNEFQRVEMAQRYLIFGDITELLCEIIDLTCLAEEKQA